MSRLVAVVDCGSNSTRLLVLGSDGEVVDRRLRITRLAAGVDAHGRLDPAALRRTLDVLAEYRDVWERAGVTSDVRIAATSAVRDAANHAAFFEAVRDLTGVAAEVLSGQDEARLSYRGAVAALDVAMPVAVVDIGGGSTELVVGDGQDVRGAYSMQLGSVRVAERHLHDDPPTDEQVRAARAMIAEEFGMADRALAGAAAVAGALAFVGVAGTVTTLAALHLGLASDTDGVHGCRITADEILAWSDRLLAMTTADRAALEPVLPGREDVIHAGVLILACLVEHYAVAEVIVSEADILDGLARSMLT